MGLVRLLKSGNFTHFKVAILRSLRRFYGVSKVAILGSLTSGNFKEPLKWQFYRDLKVAILRSLKSGNFTES